MAPAAGALVTVIAALGARASASTGPRIPGITAVYTHQLILGFSALAGYILLLCKRRVGLYVILLGVGLMLGAQAINAISLINSGYGLALVLSTLLGAAPNATGRQTEKNAKVRCAAKIGSALESPDRLYAFHEQITAQNRRKNRNAGQKWTKWQDHTTFLLQHHFTCCNEKTESIY